MLVWVYPEKVHEPWGARRWTVEWEQLRPECKAADTTQENDGFDYDRDLRHIRKPFKTQAAAQKFARELVANGKTFFGVANVQEEVVDWYVEEDRVAHWTDTGDPMEVIS
jgi:hypothetical protein